MKQQRPTFSILHTSARPEAWRRVYDAWLSSAVNAADVEYVLVVDPRWGFPVPAPIFSEFNLREQDKILVNTGRMCYVDGVNLAAQAATGQILIVVADDQFPCGGWDAELLKVLAGTDRKQSIWASDFVVRVSTGTPTEHERNIMVMPVLSRSRYERLGFVFFPEYESMYADNDFSEHAEHDGVVIDAKHLMFLHRHPLVNSTIPWDAAYAQQNRKGAYEAGRTILEKRRASGFASGPSMVSAIARKVVALCLPGDHFSGTWLAHYTGLLLDLLSRYTVVPLLAYSSNVYVTRACLVDQLLKRCPVRPDFVLWLDDDNVLSGVQFETLMADLEAHSELSGVAGWSWIAADGYHAPDALVSCGTLNDAGRPVPYSHDELMHGDDVKPVGYTGFPAVLLRMDAVEKLGAGAFAPMISPVFAWGFSGEDVAYCVAAQRAGLKLAVDSRVKLPHLKLRTAEPADMPVVQIEREVDKVLVGER